MTVLADRFIYSLLSGPFARKQNDQNCTDSCFCFLLVYTKTITFDLTTDSKLKKRKRRVKEEIKQRANNAKTHWLSPIQN